MNGCNPRAIDRAGAIVVGGCTRWLPPEPSENLAALWRVGDSVTGLGLADNAEAFGVNGAGTVLVGTLGTGGFHYEAGEIETFAGQVKDVSDDGAVLVGTVESGAASAFRRVGGGAIETLPALRPEWGARASALSGDGRLVIGSVRLP